MREFGKRWLGWIAASVLLHGLLILLLALAWKLPRGEFHSATLTLRWSAASAPQASPGRETWHPAQPVPLPSSTPPPTSSAQPVGRPALHPAPYPTPPAPPDLPRAWAEALAHAGPPASFFGCGFGGGTVVFVIDISGSMLEKSGNTTRLAEAHRELMQAVAGLEPEQRFNILFFADRVDAFLPAPAPALPDTKLRAFAYIDSGVDCGGSTNLQEALRLAMGMGPDTLLLLSDGEANTEDEAILAEVRHLRRRFCPGLRLHAIGFYLDEGSRAERFLKRLAQENQGVYAPWRPRPQEVRPGS